MEANNIENIQSTEPLMNNKAPNEELENFDSEGVEKAQILDNIGRILKESARKGSLLLTIGGVLVACTDREISAVEINNPNVITPEFVTPTPDLTTTEETTAPIEPLTAVQTNIPTITPIMEVVEPTPTEDIESEKQFDYSTLDLMTWNNYEVSDVEKLEDGYIITTKKPTMVYATPLTQYAFEFYKDGSEEGVKEFLVKEDFVFQLAEVKTIRDDDGKAIRLGRIKNPLSEFDSEAVLSIVLSATDEFGTEVNFTERNDSSGTESCATFVSLTGVEESDDLKSLMLSFRNFLRYQEENGPFKSGESYSFSDILQVYPNDETSEFYPFALNYNNTRKVLSANNFATVFAHALGSRIEKTSPDTQYGSFIVGADIDYTKFNEYRIMLSKTQDRNSGPDYVFKMNDDTDDTYMRISLEHTGNYIPEEFSFLQNQVYIYSVCSTKQPIVNESEKFDELYQEFLEFDEKWRNEGYKYQEPDNFKKYNLGGEDHEKIVNLINAIYPPVVDLLNK